MWAEYQIDVVIVISSSIREIWVSDQTIGINKLKLPFFIQDAANNGPSKGVSAQCLFDLLQSLEEETTDILDILELVKAEKPLKSLGKSKTYCDFLFLFIIVF